MMFHVLLKVSMRKSIIMEWWIVLLVTVLELYFIPSQLSTITVSILQILIPFYWKRHEAHALWLFFSVSFDKYIDYNIALLSDRIFVRNEYIFLVFPYLLEH